VHSDIPDIAIPPDVLRKWQRIVDLVANIMHVPSAVVTKLEPPRYTDYRTIVSSDSKGNPFPIDQIFSMDIGTFCETVIKKGEPLLVANALEDDQWKLAPEIAVGMISYLGFPVLWPDGRMFGTICVLDDKTNRYSDLYQEVLSHCRDVLEGDLQTLVRLGNELEAQRAHLRELQLELAHANRIATLGQLSASIAHELNQPLTGIITNCGTGLRMLTGDSPNLDGAREAVRRTLRDGNRAADVLTRLRALFSKEERASQSVDLNEATREVIALSLGELQNSRVIVRTELADNLELVTADRVQLQQVVLNLLRNALDAMNTVDDRPRDLLIRTEREEGDRVRLSVKDAGVGFDPHATDKLFEAFYSTKNDGMGVGLSVSRSIIESHQGRLWAVLNDGPGATFAFSVPCRPRTNTISA
jgi:C4-dicarboxylate-specific signal transduction histidine kinase